jgi:hypothetical protein
VDTVGIGDYRPAERRHGLSRQMLEFYLQLGFPEVEELCAGSLSIRRELGDQRGMADAMLQPGTISWVQGRLDRAHRLYRENLDICRTLGDRNRMFFLLHRMGEVFWGRGLFGDGLAVLESSCDLSYDRGFLRGAWLLLPWLAETRVHLAATRKRVPTRSKEQRPPPVRCSRWTPDQRPPLRPPARRGQNYSAWVTRTPLCRPGSGGNLGQPLAYDSAARNSRSQLDALWVATLLALSFLRSLGHRRRAARTTRASAAEWAGSAGWVRPALPATHQATISFGSRIGESSGAVMTRMRLGCTLRIMVLSSSESSSESQVTSHLPAPV